MGCLRRAAMVLFGLILFCAVGFGGYVFGDYEGRSEGYLEGYSAGEESGYGQGYIEGYEDGLTGEVGSGYTVLKDPTYRELMIFLANDNTDSHMYVEGEYVCADFAATVDNNAEEEGFRAAFVVIDLPGERSHAIVAFETVDKGLIYIEPQFDDVVEVSIRISYSQANGYQEPAYDDTITRIMVVW